MNRPRVAATNGADFVPPDSQEERAASASSSSPRLEAKKVTVAYGDHVAVNEVDLSLVDGGITCIVGPNGCGKSTLLRTLGRLLRPSEGQVLLDGKKIDAMRTRDVACLIGVLPQGPVAPEGITVADLVTRGRHPHQSWLRQWSSDDEDVVNQALQWTNMAELADRAVDTLSGGQRQRAWMSMVLAQDTDLLLLDEPTTYLDLAHAIDVLDLVDTLHTEAGRTVVMVLHDLNLAARYCDRLVLMSEGQVVAQGRPADVLTEPLINKVFGLRARVLEDPVSGGPLVIPVGTRHVRS